MAARKPETVEAPTPLGFDIISTVGRVEFGHGESGPMAAAMQCIGELAERLDLGETQTFRFDPTGHEELFVEVRVSMPAEPLVSNVDEQEEAW
jgi:hypothetical protein